MTPSTAPQQIVLVGNGARAGLWVDVVRRSSRLALVARVVRPGLPDEPGVATHASLRGALEAFPAASVLVALPPRSGLEAALALAAAGRRSVVEFPLAPAFVDVALPPGAAAVQAALGWVSLGGRRFVEQVLARMPIERVSIETRGLPEATTGDLEEAVLHAAGLVARFFPRARLLRATRPDEGLVTAEFEDGARRVALRVLTSGAQLHLRLEGRGVSADWSVEDGVESFALSEGRGTPPPARPARTGAERAVAQLFDADAGTTLVGAQRATRLARVVLEGLGERFPPGARRLAQAAALVARRPTDLGAQLGLVGALPSAAPAPPVSSASALDELWAFRAGLKPVAFLTVRPREVESTLAAYGPVHAERRDRRVFVGAQDTWVDRRDLGEERVELYVSRDPELARRAADVQSLTDPSAQLRVMGGLMGYPPCCIDAFARQDDRANNTRNRYATVARTRSPGPWPWELNNLVQMLVPFFPCRYDCDAALAWARRALQEFERTHPGSTDGLRRVLGRPVLYFDHARQIVFEGRSADGRVRFDGVQVGPDGDEAFARFAGGLARGDGLALDDEQLQVWRGDGLVVTLRRTDPALGFVAPFAP